MAIFSRRVEITPSAQAGNVISGPLVLKRFGSAEEVAALVVHLASPAGATITGQTYNVDGGWTV